MKVYKEEPEMAEESSGPDPQAMLEQGKQLCEIGQSIMAAAQAMGATEMEEEVPAEAEGMNAPAVEGAGEVEEAPAANPQDFKKNAIILAIKKKLGGK